METTVARFDGTLCEQWWPLLYSFSKLLTYIGIMQWDKNRFQKNITTKHGFSYSFLPCVTPQKKIYIYHVQAMGYVKNASKRPCHWPESDTSKRAQSKQNVADTVTKLRFRAKNFFFPHYLFLEIRRRVVKSISDTPCLSMCCCILCWDSLFNEEFHYANRTR